jgi:hypothetical protein
MMRTTTALSRRQLGATRRAGSFLTVSRAFLLSKVPERAPKGRGWPGLARWMKARIRAKTRNRGRDWAIFCRSDGKKGAGGLVWLVAGDALTRCHSASSLFSAIYVFQKSYTGNILRIGRNKSRTSYFYRSFAKTEDETEGAQGPATPQGGAAQPLAAPTYGEGAWSTS